jgi:hypothetical protein
MSFKPKERAAAISEGKSKYFTGRPCKHGHIAERRVDNGACSVCEAQRTKKWFAENPEKLKKSQRKSYAKRAEQCRKYAAEYRANNLEKVREGYRKSKLKNRAYHTYLESQRQKKIKQATPSWLTKEDKQWMVDIYKLSKQIKDEYGVVTAVDHIIPIKGKTVCGLNVPSNLRVVTQKYNSEKSNRMEEHLPVYQSNGSIMIHESAMPWNLRS